MNQSLFRTMLLATYNGKCCITQIANPELLIAGHIVPWGKDEKNRLNPINALHDEAFENGLIIITEDYTFKISTLLKKKNIPESIQQNLIDFEGMQIHLPDKFLPAREFLRIHNERFK